MNIYTILPILGIKNDVPPDSPGMFRQIADGVVAAHCADGRNVDFSRKTGSCSKAVGKSTWSNSATATTQNCLGIFELYDNTNRTQWVFMGGTATGRIFRYDSSRDPVRISDVVGHSGATEWSDDKLYSAIRFGSYMVLADWGEHTPYCADYNDTALVKLISSGTEYTFRYLMNWQNRIHGFYSDQTNGHLEHRWSNLLPTPGTSCTFAAGDAQYVPTDDAITGAARMGRNAAFVYGAESICRLEYYRNYSQPFGLTPVVDGVGSANHHGIIDIGNTHFFFNRDYGFCSFNGQNYSPISRQIKGWINSIKFSSYQNIVGAALHNSNEIAWAVPLDGETYPNAILFYNYVDNNWRRKDVDARYIYPMLWSTGTTMNGLIALGYTTWEDFGDLRMIDFLNEENRLFLSNTDGKLYYEGTESDAGSDWSGYRVEPILDFGRPHDKDLLLEIWFSLAAAGDYNLFVSYRGGDTVAECENAGWEPLQEVSCYYPDNAVCRLGRTNRFHQIKWGTDQQDEPFSVEKIEFKYIPQGRF